jgi:hypothetical protein
MDGIVLEIDERKSRKLVYSVKTGGERKIYATDGRIEE